MRNNTIFQIAKQEHKWKSLEPMQYSNFDLKQIYQ